MLPSASNDLLLPSGDRSPMSLYKNWNSEFKARLAVPTMHASHWPVLMASKAIRKISIPLTQLLSYATLGPEEKQVCIGTSEKIPLCPTF